MQRVSWEIMSEKGVIQTAKVKKGGKHRVSVSSLLSFTMDGPVKP